MDIQIHKWMDKSQTLTDIISIIGEDGESVEVTFEKLPELISKLQEIKDQYGPVYTKKE